MDKEIRMGIPEISVEDFNYDLPEERIAQYPVKERDTSRLLIFREGRISQDIFRNISYYLPEGSLMVFNNTRVIRARLLFRKGTGANIEIFCLEPLNPSEYQQSFSSHDSVEWKCIIGNLKKWKKGKLSMPFNIKGMDHELCAEKICEEGEAWRVRLSWDSKEISFGAIIDAAGHLPLPPYVKREDEKEDNIRYQTIYSKTDGSVAAPTAGLHFTPEVLEKIGKMGIRKTELTLHVGAGTFQPVRSEDISEHEMHCEHFFISRRLVEELIRYDGKIISTGTTTVRSLESIYWIGSELINGKLTKDSELFVKQWVPYENRKRVTLKDSLEAVLSLFDYRGTSLIHASTKILIIPGYEFMVTDGMITNFHQPKSTLLLLVSAWTGSKWRNIYNYALENGFRFLSFGDASLLLR